MSSADGAAARIADGATLACGGFVGAAHPEALTAAIERRFLRTGRPRNLTLLYGAGQGDARTRGLNHLAHERLLKRVVGGHWGLAPGLGRLALENKIEAYNFPQGVVCQLLRDIAAGRPGCITHVGLDTFIDPLQAGGRLNDRAGEDLVERVQLAGKAWLFYHAMPVDVGLIRASAADPHGNLIMEEEAVIGEVLPIAQAARNCGGIVLAQVKRLLDRPAPPHRVRVPGALVDQIVLAEPEDHHLTFGEPANESYYSAAPDVPGPPPVAEPLPLLRRIVAERACDELPAGAIANLGIGMPEGIAGAAARRGLLERVTLTVESGPIGGQPAGGLSFGAAAYPEAIIDQPAQFDFYDGGGLDFAALGAAEVDVEGNVNVSRFGARVAGVGGFINISQNAQRLVFCGSLTSDGLRVEAERGKLRIASEGRQRKFVQRVEQISFSGRRARQHHRDVLYVTERAVFRLQPDGLHLVEIAPGIDLQRDVLDQIEFDPIRSGDLRQMRTDLFLDS